MIGMMVSYKMFSTNGFNFSIVFDYFVLAEMNFRAWFKHFDPTKNSLRERTS